MNGIYFDNAATSFPKPPGVAEAVAEYISDIGANINRSSYAKAYDAESMVFETRQLLCDMFNGGDLKNAVFTKNITESLNVILKGLLKPGDHVITSSMEHNAVMRPLVQLEKAGVSFSRVPCTSQGKLILPELEKALRDNTRAVVMTHASNVCGTVMPVKEVGEFCREHGLIFILDSAQTAGVLPIDMEQMNIDALCFTGHKGLLGPQGIGGFILKEHVISQIEPLISGGTGSISHTEDVPSFMPDRFEAGTLNLPGIAGLNAPLKWIDNKGIDAIRNHELKLTEMFVSGLEDMVANGLLRIVGLHNIGVISVQTINKDLSEAALELEEKYKIMTRVGLHCAPSAHKTLGTYPEGTIRFSFGWNNTEKEVETAIEALRKIVREA